MTDTAAMASTPVEFDTNGVTAPVPFIDLVSQQLEIFDDVRADIEGILRRADFIGGPHVAAFEAEFAAFTGVSHCVGVGNGTDALELALRALRIGDGQEVLVPVNSFIATAEAVVRAGAHVRFADVDEESLLLNGVSVDRSITRNTVAVMAVHLYGQAAPIEEIAPVAERNGALVIEDAAQSQGAARHGRPAGSLAPIAGTSFYPGKNLGAAGDGGAVLTSDDGLAERVRVIANHGSAEKYVHGEFGFNSRLDAIQAVVLRAKLVRLHAWNEARRAVARRYDELLADIDGVRTPVTLSGNVHSWHIYAVRVEDRDRVLAGLLAAGIGAGVHYPTPIHLTGAFRHLGLAQGDFPVAESAARQLLSLPIYPHLTEAQQFRVVDTLKRLV